MKILIVEDEVRLAEAVAQILKKNNYSTDTVFDGEDGLDHALSGIYDIIILDIMLPKKDGLSVLKELRRSGIDAHVILLTARAEISDRVAGLDCGADDYLPKPFSTEELLARLRALARRKNETYNDGVLRYGDIELRTSTLSLNCGESVIKLTVRESELLELLICYKGMAVSKDKIIEKLWGYDTDAADNNVEVYVSFLRKKMNHIKSKTSISTMRGVGYTLECR